MARDRNPRAERVSENQEGASPASVRRGMKRPGFEATPGEPGSQGDWSPAAP